MNSLVGMRLIAFLLILVSQELYAQNSKFVNVFLGTDGTGHTFPGPSMPFGLVQPGPDQKSFGWNHTSGYQYKDTFILGFSQTRLSGTGINELGDILMMPFNPKLKTQKNYIIKRTEIAKPGYYSIQKKDGVQVELSCSERVAFHQYTFPNYDASLLIDFQHGLRFVFSEDDPKALVLESDINIENNQTISGYCYTDNWVKRKYFFVIKFDLPFDNYLKQSPKLNEKAAAYLFNFKTKKNHQLKVKVALSTVSTAGANNNLQHEISHWNFTQIVKQQETAWNHYLNRIQIKASPNQKQIFYTCLYHVLLQPSNIADVDGQFRGPNDSIGIAPQNEYYSTLSIWDIYRAAFPLLQIIAPEKINGIIQSLLIHHKQSGFLPIWTVWGQDNYCMIGNHSIPMILSAYKNGFKSYDTLAAWNAMLETSIQSHINSDWKIYQEYGYYPFDLIQLESVSKTLESGYDDWCVAEMARAMHINELVSKFDQRAKYFKNLYETNSQFFRGKDSKGNWRIPFDPLLATSPLNNPGDYTEANAWQYFWTSAQYDIDGICQLLGGKSAFQNKLIQFFETNSSEQNKFLGQEAMIGQYAHGNEPGHHIPYLFAYTQANKYGQKLIHRIIKEFHYNSADGMIGNDDCGQMSAWYILSSLGFYPINPASGEFVLGSPQINEAIIQTGNNQVFTIRAHHLSEQNIYNDIRKLNGQIIEGKTINFKQIKQSGILEFEMKEQ